MKYENISLQVEALIEKCRKEQLEFVSGKDTIKPILYNQRDILRRINFYINNRFLERDDDAIFWNLSNHRITHFGKLISPDTKDFLPYGLGELNFFQAWALRKKVREWFDNERFYKTLNDLAEGVATYGSSVWKKYKENGKTKISECKLDNLYFDQTISDIKDADGIVEKHKLNKKQLLDKEEVWDNVGEAIEKGKEGDEYEVWEFYGYDYSEDEPTYKHIIGYEYGAEYIKLWEEETDKEDCPYEDFHLGRYRGRWLRIGVVERLFKLQERVNKLVNQNAQYTEIATLLLLKSSNPDMTGNVLEQAVNGQILGDETLEQIGISNTGLNQFINELQLIEAQADKICLTPEIIQGESSPANTTFRGIAVVNAGAVNAFKNYRQDIFEKIADILLEDIFPTVVRGWNTEQLIEMAEDEADAEEYDKAIKRRVDIDYILNGGVLTPEISGQILAKMEEQVKQKGRRVKIPKGFFNFKFGFKMMPTDESVDKSAKNDAYFNALQMTGANPAITQVPGFRQYLEDNGISPWKLSPKQVEQIQQQQNRQMPEQRQPDKLLAQAQPIE
jgi:hypothetical protein